MSQHHSTIVVPWLRTWSRLSLGREDAGLPSGWLPNAARRKAKSVSEKSSQDHQHRSITCVEELRCVLEKRLHRTPLAHAMLSAEKM